MVHSNKALQNQGFLLCFWDVSVGNGSMSQASMARLRRIRAEISKHDSVQRYREEVVVAMDQWCRLFLVWAASKLIKITGIPSGNSTWQWTIAHLYPLINALGFVIFPLTRLQIENLSHCHV